MALPVTITGLFNSIAPVGPFRAKIRTGNSAVTGTNGLGAGSINTDYFQGQTFRSPEAFTLTTVSLKIYKVGAPTADLAVTLHLTTPKGTQVATIGTITAASLGTVAGAITTLTLPTPYSIAANTVYAIKVLRPGTPNTSNYYFIEKGPNSYGGGTARYGDNFNDLTNVDEDQYFELNGGLQEIYDGEKYYLFGRDGATSSLLQVYKSTAPDTSWASVASITPPIFPVTGGQPVANIHSIAGCQVGSFIHLLISTDYVSTTGIKPTYLAFNMATDTFSVTGEHIGTPGLSVGQTGATQVGVSLVVRSTGEVVAFYNSTQSNTSGTPRTRVSYSRRTGKDTWAAAVRVDANIARDNKLPIVALGANDLLHFLFHDSNGVNQRHLTAANVLGTASAIAGTVGAVHSDVVTLNDGNNIRVIGFGGGNTVYRFTSGNNPSIATASNFVWDLARGVDHQSVVHMLHQESATSDLVTRASTDFGATWSAAVSAFVGTSSAADTSISKNQIAYPRGNNFVFPYVVNDNGTQKYNEYVLGYAYLIDCPYDLVAGSSISYGAGSNTKIAQKIVVPAGKKWTVTSFTTTLSKQGAPTDGAMLEIRSGTQDGTVVAFALNSFGSATPVFPLKAFATYNFTPITLDAGTYYFVASRSGPQDASNYWSMGRNTVDFYPPGENSFWNGVSWVNQASDLVMQVSGFAEDVATEPLPIENYVKHAGVWKKPTATHVKHAGTWKTATTFVKHAGTWKQMT